MSEISYEFTIESKNPEKDFFGALKVIDKANQRLKNFHRVYTDTFQPTNTNIGDYYFIAEEICDNPKSIYGLAFVVSNHKTAWENKLDRNFDIADLKIPIPRVRFILDQTVEPPIIICRATL